MDLSKLQRPQIDVELPKLGRVLCRVAELSISDYQKLIKLSPPKERTPGDFTRALVSVACARAGESKDTGAIGVEDLSSLTHEDLENFAEIYLRSNSWLRRKSPPKETGASGGGQSAAETLMQAWADYEAEKDRQLQRVPELTRRPSGIFATGEREYRKLTNALAAPFNYPSLTALNETLKRYSAMSGTLSDLARATENLKRFEQVAKAIPPFQGELSIKIPPNPILETNREMNRNLEELTSGVDSLGVAFDEATKRAFTDAADKSAAASRQAGSMILATWCAVVVALFTALVTMGLQIHYARQENGADARLTAAIENLTRNTASQGERTAGLLRQLIKTESRSSAKDQSDDRPGSRRATTSVQKLSNAHDHGPVTNNTGRR